MPTVLRLGSLRFYFYANDHHPPHIHVTIGKNFYGAHIKIVLETLEIVSVNGFSRTDAKRILKITEAYQEVLITAWENHFEEKV